MPEQPERTRVARAAAEAALVRVIHHYGATPEFVLLGGLIPELLCSQSDALHLGTTDIDVQVDLKIIAGSTNAKRLENALANCSAAGVTASPSRSRLQAKFVQLPEAIVSRQA